MSRRKGRILAFQGLYSWDVGKMKEDDILSLSWDPFDKEDSGESEITEDETKKSSDEDTDVFAKMLIAGTIENCDKIDAIINKHLTSWDFSRVNKVSLAILRMSVYSLLFQKEIPATVVIDEAIVIAKEYGQDDSFKFINAVLDNVKKEISEDKIQGE